MDLSSSLLSTCSTHVLVNYCAGESFWYAPSLRQWDPFFPLLFIITMDVLAAIFRKAESADIFAPLHHWRVHHSLSLYAHDVVLLIKSYMCEVEGAKELLECFGAASGFMRNFTKSSISLIRCEAEDMQGVANSLGRPIWPTPITYLGLPLSLRALTKPELQPLVWHPILINSKLPAMPIFHMMALDLAPWFSKYIDKLRRGFFWSALEDEHGGCCLGLETSLPSRTAGSGAQP